MDEFVQLQPILKMTIRNRETNEVLLTIDCTCRRRVPNIIGWSALSFDISDCDGQVVIIGQDEKNLEKKLQKSKCTACVLEEFEIELNDDDCYFPVYIISRSDAANLRAIKYKLDIRIANEVIPGESIQRQRKLSPNPISRPAQSAKQTPDSLHMYLRNNWVDTVTAETAHGILVAIMDHFQQLECETQPVYDMSDTTQLIFEAKLISKTCPLMFSVYVFYLMHIANHPDKYICTDLGLHIEQLISYFYRLIDDPRQSEGLIAQIMEFRNNHDLKDRHLKRLAKSFPSLIDNWLKNHSAIIPEIILHIAIPLINIAHALLWNDCEIGRSQRTTKPLWETYLLKHAGKINFQIRSNHSSGTVNGLLKGLNFQVINNLSSWCYFSPRHLKDLIILPNGQCMISLLYVHKIVSNLPIELKHEWKTKFVSDFVEPLRTAYRVVLRKHEYSSISSRGDDWSTTVIEGIVTVIEIQKFIKRNECSEPFDETLMHWLKMFVKCVKFELIHDKTVIQFMDVLFAENYNLNLSQQQLEKIKSKLLKILEKNLKKISPDGFLIIENYTHLYGITDFKLFRLFFDETVIKNYIRKGEMVCSESPYQQVIKRLYERNRVCFVDEFVYLLETIYCYYLNNGRLLSELYLDLMKLNIIDIPNTSFVVCTEDKMKNPLQDFLKSKMTQAVARSILTDLTTFIKAPVCSCEDDLQLLVCNVVLKEIKQSIHTMKRDWFVTVLHCIYTEFNDRERVLLENLNTPRLHFVCGILDIFISKVNLASDSWTSTNNFRVSDVLSVLVPLVNINREAVPRACDKAFNCVAFFKEVQRKLMEIDGTLTDRSISYKKLEDFRKTDNCQELQCISRVFDQQGLFREETIESIHSRFIQVLQKISDIIFPAFEIEKEKYYDSLFRIMKSYQFHDVDELLLEVNGIIVGVDSALSNESGKVKIISKLEINGSKSVVELEDLLQKLIRILGCLCDKLRIFSFFKNFNSACFWKRVKDYYAERMKNVVGGDSNFKIADCANTLSLACDDAIIFVNKTVEGNVSLNELGLGLSNNIGEELRIFEFFVKQSGGYTVPRGHAGFLALQSLTDIRVGVLKMEEVFNLYDLHSCMQNGKFRRLSEFAELLRHPLEVHLSVALNIENEFSSSLPNSNGDFNVYFELFEIMKGILEYIKFLRSKGFVGTDGKRKFSIERTLMTQEIPCLEQKMIDDLWDAFSTLIFFLDTDVAYGEFIDGLQKLGNVKTCIKQIKTLKTHPICEITRIFALKEVESRENTLNRLASLFKQGGTAHYVAVDKHIPITFTVHFWNNNVNTWEYLDLKTFLELATSVELLQINNEHKDDEKSNFASRFLLVYEICLAIIDILKELRETGHFEYQTFEFKGRFCDHDWEDKLKNLKRALKLWQTDTVKWREQHPLLSFFCNWKINQLFEMLHEKYDIEEAEELIRNSLLFAHCPLDNIMNDDVVKYINVIKSDPGVTNVKSDYPFSFIGRIIHKIWDKLKDASKTNSPLKDESNFLRLYSITDQADLKLYNTAIYMLESPMTSFQIMPCTTMTNQEAIMLFFQRIKQMPKYRYILLEVNLLSSSIQEVVIKECYRLFEYGNEKQIEYDIVSIESKPSLLRTMAWCFQDNMCLEESAKSINHFKVHEADRLPFTLVCGHAGNGKSHYIRSKMSELQCTSIVFPINEGFNIYGCIDELNRAAQSGPKCSLHLNFTLPFLQSYTITEKEDHEFKVTCKIINWFFFSLFLCGYVEDYHSGISFSILQFTRLHVFVEIPVLDLSKDENDYLKTFNLHFPIFSYMKSDSNVVFTSKNTIKFDTSSSEAKLVGKYFNAKRKDNMDFCYRSQSKIEKMLHLNFQTGGPMTASDKEGVKIDDKLPDLSEAECFTVLEKVFKKHGIEDNKLHQKMFVRYMYKRCKFMEESDQFRFFEGSIPSYRDGQFIEVVVGKKLRSSLLYLMECEASEMCCITNSQRKGFHPPNIQLIYEEGSFSILTRGGPAQISQDKMDIIENYKFEVPNSEKLKRQDILETYLCRALNIKNVDRIPVLKEKGYVLTLDYLLKMIAVHERRKSGVPVILSGETGVGKTFLLETMCSLYNFSYEEKLKTYRESLCAFLSQGHHGINLQGRTNEEIALQLETLDEQRKSDIFAWFQRMQDDYEIYNLFTLIELSSEESREITVHNCKTLVLKFLFGSKRQLFQTMKVHTGLTPDSIRKFLEPIVMEHNKLISTSGEKPIVTIFFDEVNTSSCIGFLKEIIVDHSLDGKLLPENIFIVGACNPHRGNSVSTIHSGTSNWNENWFKGDYLVRPLHPSFKQLIWDFGYLEKKQEDAYIEAKLKQVDSENSLSNVELITLASKIKKSQQYLRQFTSEYLQESGASQTTSKDAGSSAVSQRDIQRVLKVYIWLKKSFQTLKKYGFTDSRSSQCNWHISIRALYTALALVYYFRLSSKYRAMYAKLLDDDPTSVTIVDSNNSKEGIQITFSTALNDELTWLIKNIELPPGVANIKALRENLYLIVVCCMTNIPLIITGPPGCSKTLSFKIAFANMQSEVSPKDVFRKMKGLEPHIYQCSKHSVTDDINSLFTKATARQAQIDESGLPSTVVVFMDEVGLPDEKLQILKVLHHHLDESKVPFVALSNTTLDAAKSNRAICLFQTKTTHDDLQELAVTILGLESTPDTIKEQIQCITKVFMEKMESTSTDFNKIFGLRDIMHFFSYIRKHLLPNTSAIPPEMIALSLRRNFSGTLNFDELAKDFLSQFGFQLKNIFPDGVVSAIMTLKESLADRPKDLSYENEVRYKLLINRSEDETIVQLLFKFGILKRKHTRIYSLSKGQGDKMQKTTMVAKIKNSIANGHTIILIQCDEIFENFYDLFNQRFTFIDDHKTKSRDYYARIASGARSTTCFVHPNFQCVVMVKQSEVHNTPAPFMNRFEKYPLSHESFLFEIIKKNDFRAMLLCEVKKKVEEFLLEIPTPGLYGFQDQTLHSLLLAHVKTKNSFEIDYFTISPGGDSIVSVLEKYFKPTTDEILSSNTSDEITQDIKYVLCDIMKLDRVSAVGNDLAATFSKLDIDSSYDANSLNLVRLITQLLCVRLIKKLLQLMPPEIFLAMKEKLPSYYVTSYLQHQFHFSLQELVSDRLKKSETRLISNKTLCFSRTTSYLFENLPIEYFAWHYRDISKSDENKLKSTFPMISDQLSFLCVLQLLPSNNTSDIVRKIKTFILFDRYDVLLVLVNMQDISIDIVNNLRLIIEETEFQFREDRRKQFIVLLHFPGDKFFLHCYPAYFLEEWDLCYVDSIAHMARQAVDDLKTCFYYAYNIDNTDTRFMERVVHSLLSSEFASHLLTHLGTKFSHLVVSSNDPLLILIEKDRSIGKVLQSKFCLQWSPVKMLQTLQQAANSALCLDYTLSMTDAISTIIATNFFDFMYYILTLLARHGVLFLLLNHPNSNPNCPDLLDLICYQIEKLEMPTSSTQMKLLRAAVVQDSINAHIPKYFPFFHIVFNAVEDILKQNRHYVKGRIDFYAKKLEAQIETQSLVFVSVDYMSKDFNIWSMYILEFLSRFYGNVKEDSEQFKYFHEDSQAHPNIYSKLVWLHCSFLFVPRNIRDVLSFFDTIGKNVGVVDAKRDLFKLFADSEKLAEEIITQFFNALTFVAYNIDTKEHFRENVDNFMLKYHEVFLSSPLKDLIYVPLSPEIEVKRDGMAVFFTFISSGYAFDIAKGLLQHFTNPDNSFTTQLNHRITYLMKLPVEKVADTSLVHVLSPQYGSTSSEMSSNVKQFLMKILKIVVSYSSDEQKEKLIDWICKGIITGDHLQLVPFQNCSEETANLASSICFINQFFSTAIDCDYDYFKSKVEGYVLESKATLKPYFLNFECSTDRNELLKSLLFLREVQAKRKRPHEISDLVSQYRQHLSQRDDLMNTVTKEVIKFFLVEETAKNITMMNRSNTLIDEVNGILTGDKMYGLFLVFRLLKCCKSFSTMKKVLLKEEDVCKEFSCLSTIRQSYYDQLDKNPVYSSPLPSTLLECIPNDMLKEPAKKMFKTVAEDITSMVSSPKQEVPRNLQHLLIHSNIPNKQNKEQSSRSMLIINLFLSIYHHIYMQEIRSSDISKLLMKQLRTFICPEIIDVMSIFITGEVCNMHNRLVATFLNPLGQTEEYKDMWGCVCNLIASLLGTFENQSNFSVHLFQPNSLVGTYVPGSTTRGPVGKCNKKMYQAAMMLSESGLCSDQQSFNHLTRGTISLPCLYFIQWANYACLCIHSLVFKILPTDRKNSFNGELFEDPASAQLICLESMKRIWELMVDNLNLLAEQRLMLINHCIGALTEKFLNGTCSSYLPTEPEYMDKYEKFINDEIFIPSWNTMLKRTETYESLVPEDTIDSQIIHINKQYPIFADKMACLLLIMSSNNLHNKQGPYYVLYQYLIKRTVLSNILQILPDAVDFYHWIHEEFSDRLTRAEINPATVQQLLETNSCCNVGLSDDIRDQRFRQFLKLCSLTETFQKISFGLFSDIPVITTSIKLNEIISTPGTSGALLTWIENLINRYNEFLMDISDTDYGKDNYFLKEIMKDYNEVTLVEACEDGMKAQISRFDDLEEILPLLEKCCCLSCTCRSNSYEEDPSLLRNVVPQVYHLNQLQDDVTSQILSRFRRIKQASSLAMTFSFKNIEDSVAAIFVESSAVCLGDLDKNIPSEYKNKPDAKYIKQAMRHCHSLSYHSLLDITIGLRIAAEFIIQVNTTEKQKNIKQTKLPIFLKTYILHNEDISTQQVLKQVLGVDVTRLNERQSGFLGDLLMKDIMKALNTFVMWLQDGMYDFSSFPLVLKDDLGTEHEEMLKKIREEANKKGELHHLLEKIQIVTHSLSMCEKIVRDIADPASSEMSLKKLVLDYVKSGPNTKDFDKFPDVPVSQYVRYRLSLRKMHHEISNKFQETKNVSEVFGLNSRWDDIFTEKQLVENLKLKIKEMPTPVTVKDLSNLSCQEVAKFINDGNLGGEYAENVVDREVDGEMLLTWKDKQLRYLIGMKALLFLQFKFMIKRAHNQLEINTLADMKQTVEFCSRHDVLKEAIPFVVKYQLDGQMLLEADRNVMKELIPSATTDDHLRIAEELIQTLQT